MQGSPGCEVPLEVLKQCEAQVARLAPSGEGAQRFVRHCLAELRRTEAPPAVLRSPQEWQQLFPRYPKEGFWMKSYEASEALEIRRALETFGVCVVRVLTPEDCERSVVAMFEEINEWREAKGIQGPKVDVEDATTWFDKNWPSSCKFLLDAVALHPVAFANRCSGAIYQVFQAIFQELQAS